MKDVLQWGLLSTARINRRLIPPLRDSKRNHLAAVASRDEKRARQYAAEMKIPAAYGSYEAMLADPHIDVVYIPLPNSLHVDWTVRAAEAGKHVLCEKPLALTVEDVDRVRQATSQNGVVVMEAFMYRHHPQTLEVQRLVREGVLGKVIYLRGSFAFFLDRPDDVRWDLALGGGALWDVGCYPVSFCRTVLGLEPEEVFGYQVTAPGGVDLTFAGQMRFPNGVLAQIDCSFASPYRVGMEIVGDQATMLIQKPFNNIDRSDRIVIVEGEHQRRVRVRAGELYSYEVENLSDAVLDGQPQRISLEDSQANIAVLSALYESARTNRPVKI